MPGTKKAQSDPKKKSVVKKSQKAKSKKYNCADGYCIPAPRKRKNQCPSSDSESSICSCSSCEESSSSCDCCADSSYESCELKAPVKKVSKNNTKKKGTKRSC